MNVTNSVEFVDTNLSSAATTGSYVLTSGQDYTMCVPFLTVYGCSDNYNNHLIDVYMDEIGGTARINFERATTNSCQLNIKCYVVEFDPDHVYVQSGTFSNASNGTVTETVSSGFDQTRTAMVHYWKNGSTTNGGDDHMVRGRVLANGTQVDFYRAGSAGSISGHYFLFSALNDEFVVGHYDMSMTGTSNGLNIPFDSDPLNTFVIGSYSPTDSQDGSQRSQTCRIFHYFYNQIRTDRSYTDGTVYVNAQVVTFQDGADGYIHCAPRTSLRGFGTTSTTATVDWSGSRYSAIPMDQDSSIIISGTPYGCARAEEYSYTTQIDSIWTGMEYIDERSVQFTRNSTGGDKVSYSCFSVVDWEGYYVSRGTASGTLDPNITFVKSVQNETFEVEEWTNGFELTKGQDPENCALFVSYRCEGGTSIHDHMCTVFMGKPGYVSARRMSGSGYLIVNVSVVEFYPDQVKVQRGVSYTAGTTVTANVTTISGGVNKAFLLASSWSNDGGNSWDRHLVRSRIVDDSQIEFYKYDGAAELEVAWFLVEDLQDNFVTAHDLETNTGDAYLYDDSVTYDYNRNIPIGSNATTNGSYYPDRAPCRYFCESHTFHRPMRSDIYQTYNTQYYSMTIIQITRTNRRYVQHWNPGFSSGSTSESATYGAQLGTDPNALTLFNTNRNCAGRSVTSSNVINDCFYEFQITDYANRTFRGTRDASNANGYPSAVLINWLGYDPEQNPIAEAPKRSLIKSIESFEAQTSTAYTELYPTKGQDLDNCIPFFSQKASSTDYYMNRMACNIILLSGGPEKVVWNPGWGAQEREWSVHIVEFDPNQVRVQHGTTRFAGTTTDISIPIPVNPDKAFLIFGIHGDSGSRGWDDFLVAGAITASGTITFNRGASSGSSYISWHIAECLQDQWRVQRDRDHQNATTTNFYSYKTYRTSHTKTLTLASYSCDNGSHYVDRTLFRIHPRFDDVTQYNKSQAYAGTDYTVTEWVEFNKDIDIRIYRDYLQITGSSTDQTQSLKADPPMDLSRSFAINHHLHGFCRVDSPSTDDVDNGLYRYTLNSDNTITATRYQNGANSYDVYQAIEWPEINTHYFEGYVTELDEPVVRTVSAFRMDTNEMVDTTTSASGTGYYRLETTYSGMHYIVCNDDEAGASYNDLVLGKMYPEAI